MWEDAKDKNDIELIKKLQKKFDKLLDETMKKGLGNK